MIGATLKRLLDERNMNVNELARQVNASPQTLYSVIKRDNGKVDFDLLLRICRELEAPIEAFYPEGMASPERPTPAEQEFLRRYRMLDDHGRDMTQRVMEGELQRIEQARRKETADEGRIIPLFLTPAAAGYASPALGEDYEDYTVPADCPADFAARIDGDSMEPVIPDGSIVLVSARARMNDGDVGLFFVDGDMKCKQYCEDALGNIYLFSINRERRDADVTVPAGSGVTVCCFGKVLLDRRPPLPVR